MVTMIFGMSDGSWIGSLLDHWVAEIYFSLKLADFGHVKRK